jgi:hypothetical protein
VTQNAGKPGGGPFEDARKSDPHDLVREVESVSDGQQPREQEEAMREKHKRTRETPASGNQTGLHITPPD